jgi:hypothetical protein
MNSHINIINGNCPMVVVPCSFRHIGCMHQDKRCKMAKHYTDANTHHLMLLSTRLVELETKHRLDLQVCAKKFEQNLQQLADKLIDSDSKYAQIESELAENKRLIGQLKSSLKELRMRTDADGHHAVPSMQNVNKWCIDLASKRKAHFSPSYNLQNTGYKIHLWLKAEVEIDSDLYSTMSVILERCDNEDELPVSFDCCFFLNVVDEGDASSTSSDQSSGCLKTFVTTDSFHMSGHVSKPMILFKTNELFKFVRDNKLCLRFCVCSRQDSK